MPLVSHRLQRAHAALIVIDIQERLLPAIFEKERLLHNILRLVKGASLLGLPILVTEQNPQGLGPTVSEVAQAIPSFSAIEKYSFSACGATGFNGMLASRGFRDLILCGMECHVCVCQTCLDLLDHGFRSFVVADAVSSRTADNRCLGLDRMSHCGAVIVSTEMILFELLQRSDVKEFKQVLALVK